MHPGRPGPSPAVHVAGEVLSARRAGAYRVLTLTAPGVPERFRPGTFLALSVPGGHLARRPLWIHRVREASAHGATVELVVEPRGPGTTWLAGLQPGARIPLTGPLGRPFALPREPVRCLLVGEGVDAAPLFTLAERLRERGCAVTLLVGAPDEAHLLSALEARRLARQVTVVTADGSVGERGSVREVLPRLLEGGSAGVVYAAGSPTLGRAVADAADAQGVSSQVALRVPMPCGTGLCGTCLIPVRGRDGHDHEVRGCVEGPALRGDRVRWADWADRSDRADRSDWSRGPGAAP